jgi:hypothetical protein
MRVEPISSGCRKSLEAAAVNSPGREAGVGEIKRKSTEGATHFPLKHLQHFGYLNYFPECRTFGAHFYSNETPRPHGRGYIMPALRASFAIINKKSGNLFIGQMLRVVRRHLIDFEFQRWPAAPNQSISRGRECYS